MVSSGVPPPEVGLDAPFGSGGQISGLSFEPVHTSVEPPLDDPELPDEPAPPELPFEPPWLPLVPLEPSLPLPPLPPPLPFGEPFEL